jgi:hypothetical protein
VSDDPETLRQIRDLAKDDRPLLVLDVDEVVLDFVVPFARFLDASGMDLKTDTFRLHGNVIVRDTGLAAEDKLVSDLMTAFFDDQDAWQTAVEGVHDTLASFGDQVEIVLLSAMPHRHRHRRRLLLDRLGLPYSLVSTEAAKGPALLAIRGPGGRPVAFVDDIPRNLLSAAEAVPDARLFHLMSHAGLRALLRPLPAPIIAVESWAEARPRIANALGLR